MNPPIENKYFPFIIHESFLESVEILISLDLEDVHLDGRERGIWAPVALYNKMVEVVCER